MFEKILIANRGEIACRIIKTARRLGIRTVAVFSDADRNALHVRMADESVNIGPPAAAESYLQIAKIVDACHRTGAEAVHPGYGFLSEREAFPKALAASRIAFIGPNPAAIAAMGDKIASKKAAKAAGVSTVPGYLGSVDSAAHAAEIADQIGYPVMIKASAGGGGKGMRIAYSRAEVAEGYARARSEAGSAFGDDRVFVEKFIVQPRHIEIQILSDKFGNTIHLGERECSIQRRNQKVVEEAPSPLLDQKTRVDMCEQAIALARAVGYDSAGTVEFVAGQDRSFYFLEMNTRLQVEHAVTEMITGVDIVEQMIRIAAGEKLSLTQADIQLKGCAIESRIYAEDPFRSFLPSIGRLTTYRAPQEEHRNDVSVRVDTGVYEGSEISMHYDPMIAKLVTWAPSRRSAIEAQVVALDKFALEGIRHNVPFLSRLMRRESFASGKLSTGFIAEEFPDGFQAAEPEGECALRVLAVALAIDQLLESRKEQICERMSEVPPSEADRRRVVHLGKQIYDVTVGRLDTDIVVHAGGNTWRVVSNWVPGMPVWIGTVGGIAMSVQVRPITNGVFLAHAGTFAEVKVYSSRQADLAALMPVRKPVDSAKRVVCPMPGIVRSIMVSAGQEVRVGESLCVVEAMKMENVLKATCDGVLKEVYAKEGQILAVDALIMEFV